MSLNFYRAFDLTFSAPWPIPSMAGATIERPARVDVEIVEEPFAVPQTLLTADYELAVARVGDNVFVVIEDAASFRIHAGGRISVHLDPSGDLETMQMFLLGTVFGTTLHLRGILPLHSNALVINGKAVLFCGDSGAGKSTTAAFFQERGYTVLTDDVSAVSVLGDHAVVRPGIPRLKLWRNSLELLGRTDQPLKPVPWAPDKFEAVLADASDSDSYPIAAIYHLRVEGEGRPHGIHRLTGLAAANTVLANVYRRRVADLVGCTSRYLPQAARLVSNTPIFTMNRSWNLDNFVREASNAEHHILTLESLR